MVLFSVVFLFQQETFAIVLTVLLSLFLVPGAVPWLYVGNRGVSSLEIVWGSISREDANGILVGYTVYYKSYNSYENFTTVTVNASSQVLRITLTGLQEATRYQMKVAGRTSVGEGASRYTYADTGL